LMVQALHAHSSAVSAFIDHSLRADEPSCFGQQDSNSVPSCELAETPILDNLASSSFRELELEHEYDHDLPLDDSILFPDPIMTPVSPPDFTFSESTLDPIPIHYEIESPILDDHIELDQLCNFENHMDKLASSFYYIEPNEICDLDSQIYDQVQIPESLLTPVLLPDLGNILESVLIPTSIIPELESPPLSHIPLWEEDCGLEFQFLDLDPILEPSPTPEPLLDLSFFHESVFVPAPILSKSIIPSFHTPFWDKEVETINSEIYYEIWKFDGVEILKNNYTYIFVGYVSKVSGGFHHIICYLDWAAFRGPIRPPPEPPP